MRILAIEREPGGYNLVVLEPTTVGEILTALQVAGRQFAATPIMPSSEEENGDTGDERTDTDSTDGE